MGAKLIYPDGKIKNVEKGKRLEEFLNEEYLCGKIGNEIVDFSYEIKGNEEIILCDFNSEEGKLAFWHTSSHILANAVKELFPEAKLGIGPPIENGFYYDFYVEKPFTEEDLEKIEERMKEIIKRDERLYRIEVSYEEAKKIFQELKENFKLELIEEIKDEKITIYKHGNFMDLCKGPHVKSTGIIKEIKVLSSSGCYWRGDERNESMQRIYGVSFPSKKQIEEFLIFYEEAKKRDHRKLGKELELISFSEEIGPALPIWFPKGAIIRKIIENFLYEEHIKRGYLPAITPHIGKKELWKKSGHLDFYIENMFPEMKISENESYFVKPMNCPFHIQIYKSKIRSYRDLPFRIFEFGNVYRFERSGVLHGLTRVRGFTQDDAHIFCKEEDVKEEIKNVIDFALFLLKKFGFEKYYVYISTMPEEHVGDERMWEIATNSLIEAVREKELDFKIEEGEGAFYGPKIDILIEDALKRKWQCTTIQFDFNIPERFEVKYRDKDGKDKTPYLIHRALIGSFERFFGLLIEHYEGNFPLWLAPIQIRILTLSEEVNDYAEKILEIFRKEGMRVDIDLSNERISYKIRNAENEKIPYMVIIGKKEKEENKISIRKHKEGEKGIFEIEKFIKIFKEELKGYG
ncbi:MAG: threonine--tRNA ligase [candidate division WOR-3 bacterium]